MKAVTHFCILRALWYIAEAVKATIKAAMTEMGKSMVRKQAQRTVQRFPPSPKAKALKINALSPLMPSTASSMLPSLPRNALPLPHMFVIVDSETQAIFEQMEKIAEMCKQDLAILLAFGGIEISIKQVVVKPANTAA